MFKDNLISVQECMKILGKSKSMIHVYIKQKKIKVKKVGNSFGIIDYSKAKNPKAAGRPFLRKNRK